ncbi:MAG: hypothetical protein HQ547_05565 [Candidatus Omnitrophica bacterium]|nr:hypothetical protein [Candidatus Omnitrophota bacterium]
MKKDKKLSIALFGYTEVIIGIATLLSLVAAKIIWGATKPIGVSVFVSSTALVSFTLGVGILKYKMLARKLLIFFAGYIVLTKIFIFSGLVTLSPPFEVLIPSSVKDIISLIYHLLIVFFFNNEKIRRLFG